MANEANGGETGATHEGALAAMDEALGELLGGGDATDTGAANAGAEGDTGVGETEGDPAADGASGEADSGDESGGGEAGGDEPKGEGAKAAAAKGANEPNAELSYEDVVKEATRHNIQQRHANGRIKSKAELEAEIAAKQQAGGDGKGGQAAAKKAADPINDPIDKSLSQPAQERIRTLITRTKEADERAQVAEGNFNTFVTGLQSAGVTPEQYGETVSFLALFNSGDSKQQGQALEILEGMADRLASFLGVERKSADPLANHPDLIAAIQKREITPQLARQQAVMRNQQAFKQEINTHAQNSTAQAQATERERVAAVNELNQLEAHLEATDPLYARKKAAILPALKAVMPNIPYSQRKAAFERAYAAARVAPLPAKPSAGAGGTRVPVNQPMRAGKSPAGSGASAKTGGSGLNNGGPKSMFEAIWGTEAPK